MRLKRLISERFGSRLLDWLLSHRAAHHSSAAAGTRFQVFFRLFRRFLVFVARQFGNQIWKTSYFWKTTKNKNEIGELPKITSREPEFFPKDEKHWLKKQISKNWSESVFWAVWKNCKTSSFQKLSFRQYLQSGRLTQALARKNWWQHQNSCTWRHEHPRAR